MTPPSVEREEIPLMCQTYDDLAVHVDGIAERVRSDVMPYDVARTDKQWQDALTPAEFHVLREAGTEPPGSSPLEAPDDRTYVYACRACEAELFRSETKFDAHCGWPSFYAPLADDRVEYIEDHSMGTTRTEVRCARCGSHLGHVFSGEGFPTPTDLRYCINGIALTRNEPDGV